MGRVVNAEAGERGTISVEEIVNVEEAMEKSDVMDGLGVDGSTSQNEITLIA